MEESPYRVLRTIEFAEWLEEQSARVQLQVAKRISKIENEGHFGDRKSVSFYEKGLLKDAVWELRWDDGKRIYYAYFPEKQILLLLGGNKNGQDKTISQAKNIYIKTTKGVKKTR